MDVIPDRKRRQPSSNTDTSKRMNKEIKATDKQDSLPVTLTNKDASNKQLSINAVTSNRYGNADHALFIVHVHAKNEHITEPSYEVMMKRQVSRIIPSDICSIKKIGRGKITVEMRNLYSATTRWLRTKNSKNTVYLLLSHFIALFVLES